MLGSWPRCCAGSVSGPSDTGLIMTHRRIIISMYFSYVAHSGGVIDVARNVLAGLKATNASGYTVREPSARVTQHKIRTLLRFLADSWLGLRYYFKPVVLLFPNYFCLPLPGARCRTVVVVHDIMFKHYPAYVSPAKRLILDVSYRIVQKRADGVIFISKDSEQDFIRTYGAPRRHTTIYNPVVFKGASPNTVRTVGPQDKPYVIANFHYYPHKNVEGLLVVFDRLHAAWPELQLVFTGNCPPQFDELIKNCKARHAIQHLGFLPKNQVLAVVRDAAAFISLSKFEGFNMSAAEAALLGKPLILSDLPVHRELFTDCARFVSLSDPNVDGSELSRFVQAYTPVRPSFADQVSPEQSAERYISFINKVADSDAS